VSTKPIPRLSAFVLPRLAQQTIDGVVLGLPALIDPHLHAHTMRLIILVVTTAQIDRDGQGLDVYHDTPDPIGEQVAEMTMATGIRRNFSQASRVAATSLPARSGRFSICGRK
jgi:hypothetical protein